MIPFACFRSIKGIWQAMSILCLVVLSGLYHFREEDYGTPALLSFQNNAGRMTPIRIQHISINSSLTNQIWKFETSDIQQIYLFKTLLTKEHFFNYTNADIFRIELRRKLGSYFKNDLVVVQQNTPINYKFTFGSKDKSDAVQISKDIHKLLPNNITYDDIPRCSVVGNSGAISNSKCGKDIDDADFVFRCNAAPIKAFAGDAGNKTNFTTFNPSILRTRYQRLSKPEKVSHFLKDMEEYRGLLWAACFSSNLMKDCIKVIKLYNLPENKFVLGHPSHFKQVSDFWKSYGIKKTISTGLYLATVALSQCREVHLYGFWPFFQMVDGKIKGVPYHYFENVKYDFNDKRGNHDMHYEFFILVQLHNLGVLKIHIGECSH